QRFQNRACTASRTSSARSCRITYMNTIGQPISRIDGRLKTTGGARYTADIPIADVVYGVIAQSTIANGRTVSIDTTAAEQAPGVLAVFTHGNMPRMNPTPKPWSHLHPHGLHSLPPP